MLLRFSRDSVRPPIDQSTRRRRPLLHQRHRTIDDKWSRLRQTWHRRLHSRRQRLVSYLQPSHRTLISCSRSSTTCKRRQIVRPVRRSLRREASSRLPIRCSTTRRSLWWTRWSTIWLAMDRVTDSPWYVSNALSTMVRHERRFLARSNFDFLFARRHGSSGRVRICCI